MGLTKFLDELNLYLNKRFKYIKPHAYIVRNTITAYTAKFDLYFRLCPELILWEKNTFVIARIHFQKTRSGHGTDLLRFLLNYCEELGFEHIAIESVNQNSKSFAVRMGFHRWKERHYIISCDELAIRLKK